MNPEVIKRNLEFFEETNGKIPFVVWLESLDLKTQARIRHRLSRLEEGNPGDCSPVGGGVFELRCFFGPGYRVYFGEVDKKIILILGGGNKKFQTRDIQKAQDRWRHFWEVYHEKEN